MNTNGHPGGVSAIPKGLCSLRVSEFVLTLCLVIAFGLSVLPGRAADQALPAEVETRFTSLLDAPLLFVKRHSYTNMHIYDTYYGRWEYVDKNALTIQSLWTCNPDGAQETALYANNMVFPEALLDARPVSGSPLLVATLAKHNGPPRGSIAFLDPRAGKNDPQALTNLEHPDKPTHDLGDSCEPWPLNEDIVLFSGRPPGAKRNAIQMLDRAGHRLTLLDDPDICLHTPMLVKPRPVPPVIPVATDGKATTGRFLVQDVYQGLDGVKRGDVKWLRVIEETSRVSPSTMGGSPYNQTFLISAALAFSAKNYLGLVPVTEEGSAYFEVPAGRALYLQALDGDHRLVQCRGRRVCPAKRAV